MNTDYTPVEEVLDGDDGRVYVNGEPLTGQTREFHANGNVAAIVSYRSGIEDGPWQLFWPNGRLESEGSKEMDRRVGTWREWYESGQLKAESVYRAGTLTPISTRTWAADGTETTPS